MDGLQHILLIDDDELDRRAVVRALQRGQRAYRIVEAASASEGLSLAALQPFDLILLDYRLPDRDGLAVLQQLRSEAYRPTAILMLSRQEDEALATQCLEAGAQDFLLKDEVNDRRLSRALRQAHQRHRIEAALEASRNELLRLAEHDPLTGLTNRRGFERQLAAATARVRRGNGQLALLLLDLDDFKSVNDSAGHAVGDALLVDVTRRLSGTVRDSGLLCRLGGDEFVVLMADFEREEQVFLLAERLIAVLQAPFLLGGMTHITTASIGVASYDPALGNGTDLLRFADMAMYQAKHEGRNQSRSYSATLQQAAKQRARIKHDLKHAVRNGELQVFYQAQIRAADGSLGGMEALVRWQHPELGLLAPAAFIAVAEETGTIIELGNWVMQTACQQLAKWQGGYPERLAGVALALNLSAVQTGTDSLPARLAEALARLGNTAIQLELEMSESALIRDPLHMAAILGELVAQGVTLSLDDFGTGHSSLEHLKRFPISVLKIDQAFVAAVGSDPKGEQLLVAIIALARAMDMKIVAEGVETAAQAEFCARHGCHLLQGYYYAHPVPAAEFEAAFLRQDPVRQSISPA